MPERHAAFLRAINVGGNNMLPMKDLKAAFERAGAKNVVTYIQSGNVAFDAPKARASVIAETVVKAIVRSHGIASPIAVRSHAELAAVAAANPFLAEKSPPETTSLYVAFLTRTPSAERVAALDPNRSPPDRFVVRGGDIYLAYAKGAAKTKITNTWFDRVLDTVSTVRNWRTLLTMVEMTRTSDAKAAPAAPPPRGTTKGSRPRAASKARAARGRSA